MPETSLEAYETKREDGSIDTDKQRILELILNRRGVAIWQAAEALGRPDSDISGRFSELEKEGRIAKSLSVYKVNPRTGKRAHVWIARAWGDGERVEF